MIPHPPAPIVGSRAVFYSTTHSGDAAVHRSPQPYCEGALVASQSQERSDESVGVFLAKT